LLNSFSFLLHLLSLSPSFFLSSLCFSPCPSLGFPFSPPPSWTILVVVGSQSVTGAQVHILGTQLAVCILLPLHTHTHTMFIHIHNIFTHAHTYTHTNTHTHTHTHTHAHTPPHRDSRARHATHV